MGQHPSGRYRCRYFVSLEGGTQVLKGDPKHRDYKRIEGAS